MILIIFSCTCWQSGCLLWKNVYSDPVPIYKSDFFRVSFVLSVASIFILDINPLSRYIICKYLLPFCSLPFYFVDGFLCCTAFQFDVPLADFCFVGFAFEVNSRKALLRMMLRILFLMFSSKSFIASGITFKPLICIELIFVLWCKIVVLFHSFACGCPVFPTFIETILSPLYILGSCVLS